MQAFRLKYVYIVNFFVTTGQNDLKKSYLYISDTIYTERYMDTPQANPQAYANSSLLTDEVVRIILYIKFLCRD